MQEHAQEECQRVCVECPFKGSIPGKMHHVHIVGSDLGHGYRVTPDARKATLPDAFPIAMKQFRLAIPYKVLLVPLRSGYCMQTTRKGKNVMSTRLVQDT